MNRKALFDILIKKYNVMDLKHKSKDVGVKKIISTHSERHLTKDVLSFKEALVFLDISASTLYKKTHKRTISFFKPSPKRIYFLKEDLINYMLSNKKESVEDFENANNNYLNRENHGNNE